MKIKQERAENIFWCATILFLKSEELDTTDGKIVAPRSQAELRCLDADICPGAELYEIREVSGGS